MNAKRYEIYYADLDPSVGSELRKTRPVVVVSKTAMNCYLDTVVVCPLTTTLHPQWRSRIQIRSTDNSAEIAVDRIRAISKRRLEKTIGSLSSQDALKLRSLIAEMYGE